MSFVIKTLPSVPYYVGTKELDGVPYRLRFAWNTYTETWHMDLTSLVDAEVTIRGLVLLPGVDLLARFGWGHILGSLYVLDTSGADDPPTFEGMGDRWQLTYYPREG